MISNVNSDHGNHKGYAGGGKRISMFPAPSHGMWTLSELQHFKLPEYFFLLILGNFGSLEIQPVFCPERNLKGHLEISSYPSSGRNSSWNWQYLVGGRREFLLYGSAGLILPLCAFTQPLTN